MTEVTSEKPIRRKEKRRALLDKIKAPVASSAQESADDTDQEGSFPSPAAELTQKEIFEVEGQPREIAFDFNLGARVKVPEGDWKLRISDLDTQFVLHDVRGTDFTFLAHKKYHVNARIELECASSGEIVWAHEWNPRGKKIAIIMPGSTLGDTIAWFSYACRFGKAHDCRLYVVMSDLMIGLFKDRYPDIVFLERDEFTRELRSEMYATYYMGLYFQDEEHERQPADFRIVGLHKTAAALLGLEPSEAPPLIKIEEEETRPIAEPYVVIAVQGSAACKLWNNPDGWYQVVDYLKSLGYRVICIDKDAVSGSGLHWNHIPNGCEDQTGARPLTERARWLRHADFFVGLSSGLSWLAWAAETPVIMISGFTRPENEFHTPWRVFSANGCNSCWHDIRLPFEHTNYLFCPRHENTPRQFECTRIITGAYVIKVIDALMKDLKLTAPKKRRKKRGRI